MLKHHLARNKTMIIVGILSLFFTVVFIKLSMWQFARADEKAKIIEKFSQVSSPEASNIINNLTKITTTDEYSVIQLQGYFDYSQTILLSNQYHEHQLGYHVLTPFVIKAELNLENNISLQAILIDRGWIKLENLEFLANYDEKRINQKSLYTLSGLIRNSNKNQYIIGDNVSKFSTKNNKEYYQIQKINLTDPVFSKLFTPQLHNKHYLQLLTPSNMGFNLSWQLVNIPPEKHKAYAIQWLLLAITVILLYSYLCYKTYKIAEIET
jgi:surfeit locus 1 family protein